MKYNRDFGCEACCGNCTSWQKGRCRSMARCDWLEDGECEIVNEDDPEEPITAGCVDSLAGYPEDYFGGV